MHVELLAVLRSFLDIRCVCVCVCVCVRFVPDSDNNSEPVLNPYVHSQAVGNNTIFISSNGSLNDF